MAGEKGGPSKAVWELLLVGSHLTAIKKSALCLYNMWWEHSYICRWECRWEHRCMFRWEHRRRCVLDSHCESPALVAPRVVCELDGLTFRECFSELSRSPSRRGMAKELRS